MDLTPGIIVREPLPFGPRVSRDGLFEGLADALTGTLGDSDGALASSGAAAGDDVPTDLDAHYAATVGVSEERAADEARAGSQSQAAPLTDAGGDVTQLRGSVLAYLPQPEAPLTTNFNDPPDPGEIHTGRGFDTIGPGDGGGGGKGGDDGGGTTWTYDAARAAIRGLYTELLEREPDAGGWDAWTYALTSGTSQLNEIRQAFIDSDEYKHLHGG